MARIEWTKTGIVAPDGGEEIVAVELCEGCDREAEYHVRKRAFCEAHYAEYLEKLNEDAAEEEREA
jgi:hypothetical protein